MGSDTAAPIANHFLSVDIVHEDMLIISVESELPGIEGILSGPVVFLMLFSETVHEFLIALDFISIDFLFLGLLNHLDVAVVALARRVDVLVAYEADAEERKHEQAEEDVQRCLRLVF